MKKQLYYLLFVWACILASCGDEEGNNSVVNFNSAVVQEADDFMDARDNTTYRCVRIGNQIWMAENLRYQIPGNSFNGCYTWEESKARLDMNKMPVSDMLFYNMANAVAHAPQYNNWPEYDWVLPSGLVIMNGADRIMSTYLDEMSYGATQAQVLSYLEKVPKFRVAFIGYLNLYKTKLPEFELFRIQSGVEHFQEIEEENGGYTSTYGFLYSYEGALAAVPDGWRLPTDEDWINLETTLGMNAQEAGKTEAWRGSGMATLLDKGGESRFDAVRGGGNIYIKARAEDFVNKGDNWYYWSSTKFQENDSTSVAMIRMSANYTDKVWRGTSRVSTGYRDILYSVRCVKDAQ